jgi:hypothetical protein
VFQILNNCTVEVISLIFSNSANEVSIANAIEIGSENIAPSQYNLFMQNCEFKNIPECVVKCLAGTFADKIFFNNCLFHNSRSIELVVSEFNKEASFASLEFKSCVFANYAKEVICFSENANLTNGSISINHCVFDSISVADSFPIIGIENASDLSIENSVFSNSKSANPFKLIAGAKLDYCDFYRCADLGSSTGQSCLYYNPKYDANYFVTNESLFSKANDGDNIGILPWEYNAEPEDSIDIGDNPNNYENQGVWVVPTPDDNGKWESYFLKYNQNGKLKYRADKKGDVIPDFSHVGYRRGEKKLPELAVLASVSPIEGDATSYIQHIIDSVAQNTNLNSEGFKGTILIKAGTYEFSSDISLRSQGIVLRGEGQGNDGTILIATSKSEGSSLIKVGAASGSLNKIASSVQNIVPSYIPVGAKYVIVPKGHEFSTSDHICIYQQFNKAWVNDLKMDQIPDDGDVNQWVASDYAFNFEREVKRIASGSTGDSIFFYNPIVMALDVNYNDSRKVYKCTFNERIQNCGIENMQLQSVYASETDENHAWNAVYFNRAEHCWAKNITAKYFAYSCANISSYARYITVTNCTSLSPKSVVTGGRRYSFNCNGQTSLISNCSASEGRHDYVTGSRVCGPNVFSYCTATKASNDIGPHHRWAVGTLYDVVTSDNELNVRDRSNYGTGHGWAGVNQVMWNCKGKTAICQNPWVSAKNYCIGFKGSYVNDDTFGDRPRGEWDGANVDGLNPLSLYLAQKSDRGIYTDFGLQGNQGFYINDSTVELKFNQPFERVSALKNTNYIANGSAGLTGSPKIVNEVDSVTVSLNFSSIGFLPYNSLIIIEVQYVKANNGALINGISQTSVQVPDLRPIVTMASQEVSSGETDFVIAKSSKKGDVFLLFITQVPKNVKDMEQALSNGLGTVVRNVNANDTIEISTFNLKEGYYYAFAADTEGRISEKSSKSAFIKSIVSVNQSEQAKPSVYCFNSTVYVNFSNVNFNKASVHIYNSGGKLIHRQRIFESKNTIELGLQESLYFAKVSYDNMSITKKIYLTE